MKEVVKHTAGLLSANIVSQVIGLLVYPILTRIYRPEDFGLLNLFLSISGILVLLSTAEYYNAIVLPKSDRKAAGVVGLCALILIMTSVAVGCSVPFARGIAYLFKAPELSSYWWLMPFSVLFGGGWNILNYWYIRKQQFVRISGYQVSQSIFSSAGKFIGRSGFLIIATVVGQFLSMCLSLILAARKGVIRLIHPDRATIREVAKEYQNFPLYNLPRGFINLVIGQLPVLVLTPVFGTRLVGFWGMAVLLGFAPISTISRSLYQTLYQHINARVQQRLAIMPIMRKFTGLILGVGVPVFAGLYWVLPMLTGLLLGNEWCVSGEYIRWMLPWVLCSLLSASTTFLEGIFYQQKIGFFFEVLLSALRVIGVLCGVWAEDFTIAIAGYSIGSTLVIGAQYIWLLSIARKYDRSLSELSV